MSFFNLIQKKGSKPIPPAPESISKEKIYGAPTAKRTLNADVSRPKRTLPSTIAGGRKANKVRTNGSLSRNSHKSKQSTPTRLVSDSDSQESDAGSEVQAKRARLTPDNRTVQRRAVRCQIAFSEDDDGIFPTVHAADIASLEKPPKYRLAFPQNDDIYSITLQYPSASQQERYGNDLVYPPGNATYKK